SASAGEGAALTFTVDRSLASQDPQTVEFTTTIGTATTGGAFSDYTAVSGTLTFAPSDLSATFVVNTVQDGLAEGNENFSASLVPGSAPGAATVGSPATAVGTIIDDDIPAYSVFAATGTEGTPPGAGGPLVFTVSRTL